MMPYNETIQFTFKGRDQLSGPTANAQRRLDALGGSLAKTGKYAALAFGGVAVAGIATFGLLLRNGFRDAETYNGLLRQTGAVLKSTGGIANVSAMHVKTMASHLESLSLVDENLILNAENVLLTFRNIRNETGKGNNIFDQATKAAVNLSIAMHEDLQTAAVQVGKALNDPVDGMNNLRRIGVTFSKDQQKVIANLEKTGHHLQAQKLILKELTKEFGGTAEAAGRGLPGALFRLRDAITDAFRDLMIKYEPALARLVGWLAKRVPGAARGLISALTSVGNFIKTDVAPRLISAFKEYGPKIATAMGVARDKAVEAWRKFSPKIATTMEAARDKAVEVWKKFGPKITKALGGAKDVISTAFSKIKGLDWGKIIGNTKTIATKIGTTLVQVGNDIKKGAEKWGAKIREGIEVGVKTGDWAPLGRAVADGLVAAMSGASSILAKIASVISGWFAQVDWLAAGKQAVQYAVPFAIGFTTDLIDALVSFAVHHPMDMVLFLAAIIPVGKLAFAFKPIRAAIEALPFGKAFINTIGRAAAAVYDGLNHFFAGFFGAILNAIEDEFPVVERIVTHLFRGGIGDAIGGVKNFLIQKAEEAVIAIARGVALGIRAISDAIGLIIRTLTWPFRELFKRFQPKGKEIIDGLLRGLQGMLRDLGIGISEVIKEITAPFKAAGGWLINKGRALLTGLGHGIANGISFVRDHISGTIDTVTKPFKTAGSWLLDKGRALLSGLGRGIGSWVARIRSQIGNFVDQKLLAPFDRAGDWLIRRGSQFLRGFGEGFRSWVGKIMGQVGNMKTRLVNFFRGSFNWIFNGGWHIAQGLWSGLKAGLGAVKTWVSDHIFTPIKNAIISLFHIQSPSKVMANLGGHIIGGFLQGLLRGSPVKVISGIAGSALSALKSMVTSGIIAISRVPAALLGKLGITFGPNPASGAAVSGFTPNVARWAGIVRQALMAEGLSPSLMGKVLAQMFTESGGNPTAINNWDINAINGDPSRGLMQVIGGTFRAFHWPGTSWNIYDPVANIYAALNYARHRYGSDLSALGHGHGYDTGGYARGAGWFVKGPAPERVLSPRQTVAFERFLSRGGLAGHGGGGDVHIHLHADRYLGSRNELMDEFYRLARQGRLRQVVAMAGGK
jgi:hypothetical protein